MISNDKAKLELISIMNKPRHNCVNKTFRLKNEDCFQFFAH